MSSLVRSNRLSLTPDVYVIESDFTETLNTTNLYVATLTDSGTATVVDAAKGILPIVPSDGTVADNDEAYVQTKIESWLLANKSRFAAGHTSSSPKETPMMPTSPSVWLTPLWLTR